jgi:PAS domain S-box-containing protein
VGVRTSWAELILLTAPDAVVICHADGSIVLANARAHQMFGYPDGELPGVSVDLLVPDDARHEHPNQRAAYLAGEQPPLRRLALRGKRHDGTVFPVEVSLSAVTAADGETYVTAVLRDDTLRRDAEQARGLLASIVQSSHDAIVSTDLNGNIISWNPGATYLYGHSEAQMLGQPIDTVIPPDRRVDEAEIRALVAAGGRVDRYRTVRLHADGGPFSVSMLVSPLTGVDGAIAGITTIARDVSEREQAEAQVQAVLDAAPDTLLGVDDSGRVVMVNTEAERMFGFPRYDLIHMAVQRLLPGGLPTASAVLRAGGGATTPLDAELLDMGPTPTSSADGWATRAVRRRDGRELPVEISCSAVRTDSGPIVIAVIRDITARLAAQAEQQRLRDEAEHQKIEVRLHRTQRLESLGQLAGGIAHDFNNLLAVILNYASFIIEDGAGTPYADDAERIAHAGRRGSELTHQLLAFARREVVRPRPLDVNDVVTDVKHMLGRSIGEHITLVAELAPDLPAVMADPGQLEQVLVNLAVNARDAMPTGGRLTIDTASVNVDPDPDPDSGAGHTPPRSGPESCGYVRIRVSDDGSGMPSDVVEKAFDPFFTTKPSGQGTGLGLATVYGIVTQAGGTVQIYSEFGLGTTITILLPVTDRTPQTDTAATEQEDFRGHGATVLLVEDEPTLRDVTARILHRGGYAVLSAADGVEALALAEQHPGPIDVLLTDVVMPGMLGKELAEHITKLREHTRVVYMSGYAQPVLTSHGTLDPDVFLLEKPFTSTELLAVLHRQLNA